LGLPAHRELVKSAVRSRHDVHGWFGSPLFTSPKALECWQHFGAFFFGVDGWALIQLRQHLDACQLRHWLDCEFDSVLAGKFYANPEKGSMQMVDSLFGTFVQ
jgi:hypothetical protein